MINEARLKEHFLDLITTDSHSRKEREVALKLKAVMEELGASVEIDAADEFVGGNTGNVICRLPANNPAAPAFFLAAHMDTVIPGEGVKPVIDGNIIRTDGTTILGGDDKSGCAIIVEVIRTLIEKNIPHGEIEAVFTICEEVGLLGAKFLDATRLNSKYGIVLDSDDVGYLFIKTPASAHMEWTINGVAAHAGMAPNKGISTIKIAGEALANMKLGKIDHETTANIGFIHGGGPTNIIPNKTVLHGEARSLNEAKLDEQVAHMDECFKAAAARYQVEVEGKILNASVESHIERSYDSMNLSEDSPIVQLVIRAARNLEYQVQPMEMMGGCDANIFNKKGLSCANLGTGMRAIHTVHEWLDVRDLYRAASIVLEITRLNGQLTVA
jgi:tripeptide aminopeptidase